MSRVRVVAAVIERSGQLLLCRRPVHKRHGGLWEFPGGKCEVGEGDLEAIRRELREELDVEVASVGTEAYRVNDVGSAFEIAFIPTVIIGEPRPIEHGELAWVNPHDVASFDLAPSDKRYVEHRLQSERDRREDSTKGSDLLDDYEEQTEIEYAGEEYLVRDNGAVCRTSRFADRKRKLDGVWTFGRPNDSKGYMQVGSHVVHRIVAFAFHEQPSEKHVVDHIDTNRRNNRASNLRWVTRLENVLLNPITRERILRAYESLDAFFDDPTVIGKRDPNFSWMRTVTKEEAEESRKRLLRWAESDRAPKGGRLADWVYGPRRPRAPAEETSRDKQSLTPIAIQRNWRTQAEFPACPDSIGSDPLGDYVARLQPGTVASRSSFGETLTEDACANASLIAVLCRMPESSVKGWALMKITVEDAKFVHESITSFFSREGAVNGFMQLLGIYGPFVETFDDGCG